jgi:hypothetical protein
MKALRQRCHGRLVPAGSQTILLLDEAAGPLYLRFAILTVNLEHQILPALLLDDWGHELKSLEIYSWLRENGLRFPRAELFGFDPAGQEVQYFLRDLDLMARYPCYSYPANDTPLAEGQLIAGVCLLDPVGADPVRIERPADIKLPLRQVQASWWRANPDRLAGFRL